MACVDCVGSSTRRMHAPMVHMHACTCASGIGLVYDCTPSHTRARTCTHHYHHHHHHHHHHHTHTHIHTHTHHHQRHHHHTHTHTSLSPPPPPPNHHHHHHFYPPSGLTVDRLIGNIDLAPTFLAIAGVKTGNRKDSGAIRPQWGVLSVGSVGIPHTLRPVVVQRTCGQAHKTRLTTTHELQNGTA